MPLHFPCLDISKSQGSQRYSMMSPFQLVNTPVKSVLIRSQGIKFVLSTGVRTWLICFSRLEFCWLGFLVIEVLQTKKSPRGSGRWMNHRENTQQIHLLRSALCLKKKVAEIRNSFYMNLYRLWDMSSPTMPAREPLRRKNKKKENHV